MAFTRWNFNSFVIALLKEMEMLHSHIALVLSEWFLALCVLGVTITVGSSTRAILKRAHRSKKLRLLHQLGPSVSNILYVIGLRMATEVAPFSPKVEAWIDGTIYVAGVIIVSRALLTAVLSGIEWSLSQAEDSEVLAEGFIPLMRNVITLFIFLAAGIIVLKHFNYDVMSLITALGVSSLAVGLAAKDTLSNMISGFILIIDRNLHPGDRINLSGTIGDVQEIGLRSTQLRMSDGNTLIVPNSELVNTKILNLSMPTRQVTCTLTIRVPYTIPFGRVKNLCLRTLEQVPRIILSKPPWVNLNSLSEGHQLIQIGFWIDELNEAASTVSDFNEKLLATFIQESIPLLPPELSRH